MFIVTTATAGQTPERHDLHELPLPGGLKAHQLSGPDLFAELTRIGVPNILPSDGWQQLALAYSRWRNDPPAAGGVTGSKALGVT
jgi:hypothetical protein